MLLFDDQRLIIYWCTYIYIYSSVNYTFFSDDKHWFCRIKFSIDLVNTPVPLVSINQTKNRLNWISGRSLCVLFYYFLFISFTGCLKKRSKVCLNSVPKFKIMVPNASKLHSSAKRVTVLAHIRSHWLNRYIKS